MLGVCLGSFTHSTSNVDLAECMGSYIELSGSAALYVLQPMLTQVYYIEEEKGSCAKYSFIASTQLVLNEDVPHTSTCKWEGVSCT